MIVILILFRGYGLQQLLKRIMQSFGE